jgi:putative sterol carrier protein
MPTFNDAHHLHETLGGFFQLLADEPHVGPKLLTSKLKIQFNYQEPDTNIFIDLTGDKAKFSFANTTEKPDVEMTMKADTAHRFWQGQVNLVMALARREITAKGPIPKILKLLPIIQPAYKMYRPYLESKNLNS